MIDWSHSSSETFMLVCARLRRHFLTTRTILQLDLLSEVSLRKYTVKIGAMGYVNRFAFMHGDCPILPTLSFLMQILIMISVGKFQKDILLKKKVSRRFCKRAMKRFITQLKLSTETCLLQPSTISTRCERRKL